jgi:hypothetical protein
MPLWQWMLILALVVIVIAVVVVGVSAGRRRKTERLRRHYGPEYERLVFEAGDEKAAEKELLAREHNRRKLDISDLAPSALAEFADRWHQVQTRFVDDPAGAVGAADQLVVEVMRERGYPVDDFEQRAADISVDHPSIAEDYRAAHDICLLQQHGDITTEQQREAFVHYRALFDTLLDTENGQNTTQEASA